MSSIEYLRSLYAAMDGLLSDLDANGSAEVAANSLRYHLKEHGLSIRPSQGAAPRAEGLDVERLGAALEWAWNEGGYDPNDPVWVEAIAAEYARLSRPSDERVPESEDDPIERLYADAEDPREI